MINKKVLFFTSTRADYGILRSLMLRVNEHPDLELLTLVSGGHLSSFSGSSFEEITRDKLKNMQRHQKGGVSGKSIEDKSNVLISKFYKLLKGKIKIIGVGGVDSAEAAYTKFMAGADLVQLYTGMVFKGPNIASIIKKDLKELLIRDGVKNFSEIIGNKTIS